MSAPLKRWSAPLALQLCSYFIPICISLDKITCTPFHNACINKVQTSITHLNDLGRKTLHARGGRQCTRVSCSSDLEIWCRMMSYPLAKATTFVLRSLRRKYYATTSFKPGRSSFLTACVAKACAGGANRSTPSISSRRKVC